MREEWFEEPAEEFDWRPKRRLGPVRPSIFAGNACYWLACVAFALLQAGMTLVYWMLTSTFSIDSQGYVAAVQTIFYLAVLFLPPLIYILARPRVASAFRLNPVSLGRALLCLALACAGFLAANLVTLLWLALLEAVGADVLSTGGTLLSGNEALDIFLVAVLPGVCEEWLFRGMLLSTYERWGTWKAIWITSLLFTGLHGSLAGIPAELLLGVVLGFVAVSTHSLYASMMLHTAYNAVTLLSSYASSGAEAEASGTLMQQLGGLSGVLTTAVMAIFAVLLVVWLLHILDRMRVREDRPFGDDDTAVPLTWSRSEVVLMASSLGTLAWFYVQDALALFGGLL